MEEIVNQLTSIVERYKKNKKINKNEQNIARKGLEALLQSPDYIKVAFDFIPNLPQEVSIQAFVTACKGISADQRNELMNGLTESEKMKSNAGFLRMIGIVKEFIPNYTEEAIELLTYLSLMITKKGKETPNKILAERFRKELLENRRLFELPLEKKQLGETEISAISAMVLCSIVQKGEFREEDEKLLSAVLDWLSATQKRIFIGRKVIDCIEEVSKDWPEYLQRKSLDLGVIRTLRVKVGEKKLPENYAVIEQPKKDEEDVINKEDVINYLGKITKYIENIEQENEALKNEIKNLGYQLETEKQIRNEKEKKVEKMQAVLNEMNEKIAILEKNNAELKESLKVEKQHHQEEVMQLKERIDRECSYVIEEFKGHLYDKLYRYYRDFITAKNRPSDIQIADYLKNLTDRVFKILMGAGIDFEKKD